MNIEQELIDNGFVKFTDQTEVNSLCYKYSYQLRVRDEEGVTKYFINANLYDYNDMQNSELLPQSLKEDLQVEFSVQYNSHTNEQETFNVKYFGKDVEDTVKFYEKVFVNMGCDYYD